MCFSAEASFAASGVLAASSIAIARTPKEKGSVALSLIPAVFAAHQFIEGVVWLSHDGVLPGSYQSGAAYAYVLIAYVLWPIFIPFSAYRMEAGKTRRLTILACQAIGLWIGTYHLVSLIRGPVGVSADCCSIAYQFYSPDPIGVSYIVAVTIPFLASSRKSLVLFGVAVAVSCGAAAILASASTFPSVWCFFAAGLSAGLYVYFRAEAQATAHRPSTSVTSGAPAN